MTTLPFVSVMMNMLIKKMNMTGNTKMTRINQQTGKMNNSNDIDLFLLLRLCSEFFHYKLGSQCSPLNGCVPHLRRVEGAPFGSDCGPGIGFGASPSIRSAQAPKQPSNRRALHNLNCEAPQNRVPLLCGTACIRKTTVVNKRSWLLNRS